MNEHRTYQRIEVVNVNRNNRALFSRVMRANIRRWPSVMMMMMMMVLLLSRTGISATRTRMDYSVMIAVR